jgi:hypothetical protein
MYKWLSTSSIISFVTHEVTNVGNDRPQLANMAVQTRELVGTEDLDVVADRGYFDSNEILACDEAGIVVTLPKPMTSGAQADGRFGKQDFRYILARDVYVCPAGAIYRFTAVENGLTLRKYWSSTCPQCPIKAQCTSL